MSMRGVLFTLITVFGVFLAFAYQMYSDNIDLTYDVVYYLVTGFSVGFIIAIVPAAYLMWIQMKQLEHYKLSKFSYFVLHSTCIYTICFTVSYGWDTAGTSSYATSTNYKFYLMITLSFILLQLLYVLYLDVLAGQGEQTSTRALLPYFPAIIDLYDGIEMAVTKLHPENPVWVQITICLAVIMFVIPSFLEIRHLHFPELTNGSVLSKRRIRLAQFVSTIIFFVLRVVLFAYNLHEIVFAFKTMIRLYWYIKL